MPDQRPVANSQSSTDICGFDDGRVRTATLETGIFTGSLPRPASNFQISRPIHRTAYALSACFMSDRRRPCWRRRSRGS
jgi:hypothetical protein